MLILAIPAAYALAVKPVRKWSDVLFFFLSTKFLPPVAALLPLYLFAKHIGLLDNIYLLVILYTSMNLPIAVWMMRSFLNEIPKALPEAASIDGANLITLLRKIILPIASPGIAATALICFIFRWNEPLFALGAHRDGGPDRTGVPDQLRDQRGAVPGPGVRGRDHDLAAGADRRLRRPGQAGPGPVLGAVK